MTATAPRQIPAEIIPTLQQNFHIEGGAQETLFVRAVNTGWIIPVDAEGRPVEMTLEMMT